MGFYNYKNILYHIFHFNNTQFIWEDELYANVYNDINYKTQLTAYATLKDNVSVSHLQINKHRIINLLTISFDRGKTNK